MTSPLQRTGLFTGALTAQPADPRFDALPGTAQSSLTFQFYLVSAATGQVVRQLTPLASSVPTLSHDTTQTIMRTLNGLALGVADTAAIDVIKHRIVVNLQDADGTVYGLGRYMFSDNTEAVYTSGSRAAPTLMDESFIVDQPLLQAFPNVAATSITQAYNCGQLAAVLVGSYPTVPGIVLESTIYATAATWQFGTAGMQVFTDLATYGDYFNPWMANDHKLHMIRTFDPATAVPDFDWDRYPHVVADSVSDSNDLLTAPNRFIVIGNSTSASGATTAPIIGTYDIPVNAPHSIQNRGFVLPDIQTLQIDTPNQARAMAFSNAVKATVFERQTVTTVPDPRHDSYNVVRWQGENWLELSWSMSLVAGGAMTHNIRKTYRP